MLKKWLLRLKAYPGKARVEKPCSIYDQNGQNQLKYPTYDQKGWKTIRFRAAHTYIAHFREYPLPPSRANIQVAEKTCLDNNHDFLYGFKVTIFLTGVGSPERVG